MRSINQYNMKQLASVGESECRSQLFHVVLVTSNSLLQRTAARSSSQLIPLQSAVAGVLAAGSECCCSSVYKGFRSEIMLAIRFATPTLAF